MLCRRAFDFGKILSSRRNISGWCRGCRLSSQYCIVLILVVLPFWLPVRRPGAVHFGVISGFWIRIIDVLVQRGIIADVIFRISIFSSHTLFIYCQDREYHNNSLYRKPRSIDIPQRCFQEQHPSLVPLSDR